MILKELHVMPGCVTYLCLRLVIKVEPQKGPTKDQETSPATVQYKGGNAARRS